MSKFPQIHVGPKFQEFLNEISKGGKPKIVDEAFVTTLGYKSSYDKKFPAALKFLGLVEDKRNGAPTDLWSQLRSDLPGTLATCLRSSYSDLFDIFPEAQNRDDEALANFFRANTDDDANGVGRMVTAFTCVRDLARFDEATETEEVSRTDASGGTAIKVDEKNAEETVVKVTRGGNSTVNLNIQLQLPSDASGEMYDKFFAAMKKHGLI